MGMILASVVVSLLPQNGPHGGSQSPAAVGIREATAKAPPKAVGAVEARLDSGLVLVASGSPDRSYGLGDGGVRTDGDGVAMRTVAGECRTPGGVHVECQREGTRLTFPSGRELLLAPDGFVHLRDGAVAGPFEGGIELQLLDGACVRFALGESRRAPIAEVVVTAGGEARRLWRRTDRIDEPAGGAWLGDRVFCLGDGGALYRALALGPVVTLQRVLAPRAAANAPEARLALQVDGMVHSLRQLIDARERTANPDALAECQLVLDNAAVVFPTDTTAPPRISTSPLQFLLRAGYDLRFEVVGGDIRMLMARHEQRPFAEWQLGYGASVRCVEPVMQPIGAPVWLPIVAPTLQPRLQRLELVRAVQVLHALAGSR